MVALYMIAREPARLEYTSMDRARVCILLPSNLSLVYTRVRLLRLFPGDCSIKTTTCTYPDTTCHNSAAYMPVVGAIALCTTVLQCALTYVQPTLQYSNT